jgi:branched-subunit amino acid ABC-type transport system permease component
MVLWRRLSFGLGIRLTGTVAVLIPVMQSMATEAGVLIVLKTFDALQ